MNYTEHYHPNSQVSDEEMNNLHTVLDEEQAAIIAHLRFVGKQRKSGMPVGQHPAEIAIALDAAKAEMFTSRMERMEKCFTPIQVAGIVAPCYQLNKLAAVALARQITAHL